MPFAIYFSTGEPVNLKLLLENDVYYCKK